MILQDMHLQVRQEVVSTYEQAVVEGKRHAVHERKTLLDTPNAHVQSPEVGYQVAINLLLGAGLP